MALTFEEYARLVQRLQEEARRHPWEYRVRVALIAGLGYSYLLVWLLTAVGGVVLAGWLVSRAGILALLIAIPSVALAWRIVRALVLTAGPAPGLPVPRDDLPLLHETVHRVHATLKTPRAHRVLLTPHFDAGAAQIARLGVLGWHHNQLFIGVPLMHVLSAREMTAIIAHEFGHLSRDHAPFSAWVYRVRNTWSQLFEHIETDGGRLIAAIARFMEWYGPYFHAYTFVLARADEYVADQCAVELTDAATAGEALIATAVYSRVLDERFSDTVNRRVADEPEPSEDFVALLCGQLRTALEPEDGEEWLERTLRVPTDYVDTHPCLRDRLAAIGHDPRSRSPEERWRPDRMEETAAGVFLGDRYAAWIESLGRFWKQSVAPDWSRRYHEVQEIRGKLAALESPARTTPLDEAEAWDRAQWTAISRHPDEAIPVLREFLASYPDNPAIHTSVGMILLDRDDAAGVGHLERAMTLEPALVPDLLEALARFSLRHGRAAEARAYRLRGDEARDWVREYHLERARIRPNDSFSSHDLSPAWLARIRTALSAYRDIREAYLVQKDVRHTPERPLYVLSIVLRSSTHSGDLLQQLDEGIDLPYALYICTHKGLPRRSRRRVREAAGGPTYRD